jgi:hypothetical protein
MNRKYLRKQDLHTENFKIFMKKLKKIQARELTFQFHALECNIFTMPKLQN